MTLHEAKDARQIYSYKILFDSNANYSFMSHDFRTRFEVLLVALNEAYVIEVANDEFVIIRHVYLNRAILIDKEIFKANLLPIGIK